MTAPIFKKATDTDAGDSSKYGAPDVKYAFDVLDGTHATDKIQASVIETTSGNVQTDLDSKATTSTKLDDFGTPDDNTDLDASGSAHGLMPKADKIKLDTIESSATADQSDVEIETAYNNQVSVASQAEMETGTETAIRRMSPLRVAQAITALGGGAVTFTDNIECKMEVAQGTIAYPDYHSLVTASATKSGWVLPDGASASIINFKCKVPDDLAGTPNAKIRVSIMTLGAVAGPQTVNLTVSTAQIGDGENIDTALTAETDQDVTMPTSTEFLDIYEQDLTNDPTAGDLLTGQLKRDPTDINDTFTDDILITAIELIIDRSAS